jgi:hypothetical protein
MLPSVGRQMDEYFFCLVNDTHADNTLNNDAAFLRSHFWDVYASKARFPKRFGLVVRDVRRIANDSIDGVWVMEPQIYDRFG